MRCLHCNHEETSVVDSRPIETANVIRRRRQCEKCKKRFTTYERCEALPIMVIKSDNRREPFSRDKLRDGLSKACVKTSVSADVIEKLVTEIELDLQEEFVMEVPSRDIGKQVMTKLKQLDPVAYIRFASVYKEFSDIEPFLEELKELQKIQKKKAEKKEEPKKPVGFETLNKN